MPLEKINDECLHISIEKLIIHMKQDDNIDKYPLQFYWKIIGGISIRLKNHWNDYHILKDLAQIHRELHSTVTSKRGNPHIDAYICLVEGIKKRLNEWKAKITSKEINFDEILNLLEKHDRNKMIADKFSFKNTVADKKYISHAKEEFITIHQRISQLLIKINSKKNW